MRERIGIVSIRELFLRACQETTKLEESEVAWTGFLVGMRCYERIANQLGFAIPDAEIRRALAKPAKPQSEGYTDPG